MRRIFVGDIHGCLDELEELLERCGFERGSDILLPVGDLVHKGPKSAGVVRLMRSLEARPVLGNHDRSALQRHTLGEAKLDKWLRTLPSVREFDDIVLVHAGLHPAWGDRDLTERIERAPDFVRNVRYCDAQGRRPHADWPPPEPPFAPWDRFYTGQRTVVFGHWARRGLVLGEKVIGLDTGCCYGGHLTAWIAEENRLIQVKSRQPRR